MYTSLSSHALSSACSRKVTVQAPCRQSLQVQAGGGFGKTSSKQKQQPKQEAGSAGSYSAPNRKRRVDLAKELEQNQQDANAATAAKQEADSPTTINGYDLTKGNWFNLATTAEFAGEKKRKLVELKGSKKMVVLHQYKDTVYAMDAYSTAYQYPLLDANVSDGPNGSPMVETPLDGTTYDLKTGKVIKWCPTDGNPIRGVLGTLKKAADPVPLPVYPAVVKPDGSIMVRLSV